MRKNKLSEDHRRINELNARKRAGYATNANSGGTVSSLIERVNSHKLLASAIGKDEEGNDVGPSLDEFRI